MIAVNLTAMAVLVLRKHDSVDENVIFLTFDVVSLYTSIPHDLGIESIGYWIEKYSDVMCDRFTKEFILSSIHLILKNNYFKFENDFYLQQSGTAMGTKMAPTYAILFMGFLEEKMYSITKEIYNDDISSKITENWIRYIDDCFIVWNTEFGSIDNFNAILNNLNPSIWFTMESDRQKVNFLDVTVYKEREKLETKIYHKPTDSMSYVPFNSTHPKHIVYNIPYNLARRVEMLVSNPINKSIELSDLKKFY